MDYYSETFYYDLYVYYVSCRKESLSSSVPDGMQYIEPIDETEETLEVHQVS